MINALEKISGVPPIIRHTSVAPGYARGDVSGVAAGVPIKNVVYLIGEISQSIRNRITGHRQSINQPISEHFNESNYTCEDLKVTILGGPIYNNSDRQI